MKAMIFAAGLGTRLKPYTDTMPKALVEVGGVPMLGRVIEKLINIGVGELVINVHHLPDKIRDYVSANDNFGVKIHISDESAKLLDTGGGILAARRWLDGSEPFIVHNADILTDFQIEKMAEAHKASKADVTLLAQHRQSSRTFLYDSGNRLKGWMNLNTGAVIPENLDSKNLTPLAFGGVSVVSPVVFPQLKKYSQTAGCIFSTTPFYAENASHLNIMGYVPDENYRWFDIGKPETLDKARAVFS